MSPHIRIADGYDPVRRTTRRYCGDDYYRLDPKRCFPFSSRGSEDRAGRGRRSEFRHRRSSSWGARGHGEKKPQARGSDRAPAQAEALRRGQLRQRSVGSPVERLPSSGDHAYAFASGESLDSQRRPREQHRAGVESHADCACEVLRSAVGGGLRREHSRFLANRRLVHQLAVDNDRRPHPGNDLHVPGASRRRIHSLQRLEQSGVAHVRVIFARFQPGPRIPIRGSVSLTPAREF